MIENWSLTIAWFVSLQHSKKHYLKAISGNSNGFSARLEVYEDAESAITDDLVIRKIFFSDVNHISFREERQKIIITIGLEKDDNLLFNADSRNSTIKWYMYCSILFMIPKHTIPEVPKQNVVLQQKINQFDSENCK